MNTFHSLEELIAGFSALLLYPALALLLWYALRILGHLGEVVRDVVAFRPGKRRDAARRLRALDVDGADRFMRSLAEVAADKALHPLVRRFARQLTGEIGRGEPGTLHARTRHLAGEIESELGREVDRVRVLVRVGPCLGLAATLIPLGPGLAALGEGNLEMLSSQLIVAFSATVVGLAIGGVGYVLSVYLARVADLAVGDLELLVDLTNACSTRQDEPSSSPVGLTASAEEPR